VLVIVDEALLILQKSLVLVVHGHVLGQIVKLTILHGQIVKIVVHKHGLVLNSVLLHVLILMPDLIQVTVLLKHEHYFDVPKLHLVEMLNENILIMILIGLFDQNFVLLVQVL
jgi:hypothetical protein